MEYLIWAVVGLLAYSLVAPLASDVTGEMPPTPALFLATAVFLALTSVVMVLTGTADVAHATGSAAGYVYAAGIFLAVGILAYVAALEVGPVSVVVPIYGTFIVGSSVLGIAFLGESLTIERVAGIGCAMMAIYLSSEER